MISYLVALIAILAGVSSKYPHVLSVGGSGETALLQHFKIARELLPGGDTDIFSMELDVTDDGNPELFLAHSQRAGRAGLHWVIYVPIGPNEYRVLGNMVFNSHRFRYDPESAQLTVVRGLNLDSSVLVKYRLDSGGLSEIQRDTLSNDSPEIAQAKERFLAWREQVGLLVWRIELDELENSGAPVWRNRIDQTHERIRKLTGVVIE